ncbi:NUDIX hydrolase [Maribacter polysaccharolyticus]|uniref:NUDIX hydrolase n=1 Tax=Maribacter polysaccharolyticus TaxID=3020831 RepID=UPI00237F08CF|nr:NUDIX domain-containing protein [Maribacter polysaccharolyticus]MDE3740693.1 NUDIX domain-containing protein [Maribacter polysaccharolyticus]
MDELVDILDEKGNFTGKTAMKSEAHKHGLFHPTVHVWFYTQNAQVLLQQRGKDKDTHPLLWDVSVAGHVGAGENLETSAIREVAEEIGLTITKDDLHHIGVFKSVQKHHDELIDCEFHHAYLCELKVPLSQLQKQDSEVEALELTSLIRFSEETWGLANPGKYVPHGTDYYKTVIKAIKKSL